MTKKKRKPTKTALEFQRIKKQIREQERYYGKKGFDLPSVIDTFSGVKPDRSALSELKRYKKTFSELISGLKTEAAKIKKEKGVSADVAYKYIAAKTRDTSGGPPLLFEEVIINSFIERVNKMPNYESRKQMGDFIGRLINLLGSEEAARVLAETAENEQDFDAVLQYEVDNIALQNTYTLMETIVDRLETSNHPIAADELRDFMDTLEF